MTATRTKAEEWADKQCPGMDHTHIWWVAARANFEAGEASGINRMYEVYSRAVRDFCNDDTKAAAWELTELIEKEFAGLLPKEGE